MKRATLVFLLFLCPVLAQARSAAQVQADVAARFAVLWPQIEPVLNACLANQEDCRTTWSIGGTGAVADLCNTTTAAPTTCTMAQTDPGTPDSCGLASGSHQFADYGIVLPANDIMAYKINVYSKCYPGQTENCRGVQICARIKWNNFASEKCFANGPQAATFTDAAWRLIE